eukprot:gene32508-39304_t
MFAGSVVSIGISVWQYKNGNGDLQTTDDFDFKEECNDFPYNYMKPFALSIDGVDQNPYCGYGTANTSFRLAVACLTFIVAVMMPFKVFDETPRALYWTLFIIGVLWYSATVADCTAVANASAACDDVYGGTNGVDCAGSIYGVTIAIDFLMSAMVLAIWIMCADGVAANPPMAAAASAPHINKI